MRDAKAIRRQQDARTEHDEERREIDEQRCARRSRVKQPLKNQDELDSEENARGKTEPQRAIALEQANAAHPAPRRDQQCGDCRANGRLRQWRNVMDREFGRDLVETPGQAQHHDDAGGERIEWTCRRCVRGTGQREIASRCFAMCADPGDFDHGRLR